jgi:Uma2 family endonuclease
MPALRSHVMHDDLVFESTRTMSQADFAAWVAERERCDLNHFELLNGRVVMTPPAGHPHGRVEARVVSLLHGFVHPRGLGEVFGSSQGFELPTGDTVEPDASFVSARRWNAVPPPEDGKFLRVVPDLLVEILSGSTSARDRGDKRAIYERSGVREYWMVDPRARCVSVLVLGDGRWGEERVFTERERLTSVVLGGLECAVEQIVA